MHLPNTKTKPQWVKFAKISDVYFAGREWICMTAGTHILLHNLSTGRDIIATSNDFGFAGVRGSVGHKSLPYFAFAEKKEHPRILIMTCPDFNKISMFRSKHRNIQCLEFSNSELFFILSVPSGTLEIRKWRTGQYVKTLETRLRFSDQSLRTNFGAPIQLAQLVRNTRIIMMWQTVHLANRCITIKDQVTYRKDMNLNKYSACLWNNEGAFFVIDVKGHVYIMSQDNRLDPIISWESEGDYITNFCWYQSGLTIQGSDGVVKHYKKEVKWLCDWKIEGDSQYTRVVSSSSRDHLVVLSSEYDLLELDNETRQFKLARSDDALITDITIIHPQCEFFVSLSRKRKIIAWSVITGLMTDSHEFTDKAVMYIKANPFYPYISVGFDNGYMELFSCFNGNLRRMTGFQLSRKKIQKISYAEEGRFILAANMDRGEIYIIEGLPGTQFEIVTAISLDRQIADFIMVGSINCLRVFIILVTSKIFIAGNLIRRYCLTKNEKMRVKTYRIENSKRLYSKIHKCRNPELRDRVFYAVPMHCKNLHVLEAKRGDTHVRIIRRIKSQHMMKCIRYSFNDFFTMSYAYDGLVIFRTPDEKTITDAIMPHHRSDRGIILAYATADRKYVITIGRDNLVVCTCLIDLLPDRKIERTVNLRMIEAKLLFKRPTHGFEPQGIYLGACYHEYLILAKNEGQRIKNEEERTAIFKRIREIQDRISVLLTENINGPENETLDIEIFNMDLHQIEIKEEETSVIGDKLRIYADVLIEEQDRISAALIRTYWERPCVQIRTLWGIFAGCRVQSYVTLPKYKKDVKLIRKIELRRQMETILSREDSLKPWKISNIGDLKFKLKSQPSLVDYQPSRIFSFSESDSLDFGEIDNAKVRRRKQNELDNYTLFAGNTGHMFVERSPGHYDQQECTSYSQHVDEINLSLYETLKLRQFFNKKFDEHMDMKIKQLNNISSTNERLEVVLSEFNHFANQNVQLELINPQWKQDEIPVLLTKVDDSEVSVKPYISPSALAILLAEQEELDKLRLDPASKAFKQRALMVMMDGVLEITWEDLIRIDIPIPPCMIEKDPMDFNEEDLRNIMEYEESCEFLENERERYRFMLRNEFYELTQGLKNGIRDFNEKIRHLTVTRMKVDTAIEQEILKINRLVKHDITRALYRRKYNELRRTQKRRRAIVKRTQKMVRQLKDVVHEIRFNLEELKLKEKSVEKYFRKDFQGASHNQLDIILKLYRKRPKATLNNIISITVLWEVAKCVATNETSTALNHDAIHYLKALNNLDEYATIPTMVDFGLFNLMCKHRRIRIECEIRLKAGQMELIEAENSLTLFVKTFFTSKKNFKKMVKKVKRFRRQRLKFNLLTEIQTTIKAGRVHITRTGELENFKRGVTVRRRIVTKLNKDILSRGRLKIKTMKNALSYKQEILLTEWTYKLLRMKMNNFVLTYSQLDSIKMTKTIQFYLMTKARNLDYDIILSMEKQEAIIRVRVYQMIKDYKYRIKEINEKLRSLRNDITNTNSKLGIINYDVCEFNQTNDPELTRKQQHMFRMRGITHLKKGNLLTEIETNYNQILILQGELELARMATIPILDYKIDV